MLFQTFLNPNHLSTPFNHWSTKLPGPGGSKIRPFKNWKILKTGLFQVWFSNAIRKLNHLETELLLTIQKPDMSVF